MISLCSVIFGPNKRYIPYFVENIIAKTKLVSEINFCNLDLGPSDYNEYKLGKILIKEIGINQAISENSGLAWAAEGHSFGMIEAIRTATQPYIMMCDPDLLFYTAVDELYYNLMQKYNITFIGAAHHISINYSCKWFPNPINMMVKQDNLPKPSFLKDVINHENYLCPGKRDVMSTYPNPEGISDTGVLLYWWNEQIKGNWLSFVTLDVHNYTTKIYRSNFTIKEKFDKIKLFYHATSGADARHIYWEEFLRVDKIIKEECD